MAKVQDDPKDVLAFLNSLGFVGITAPQLKLFMKDLKYYRKIKDKEQQDWKNKVKEKLKSRQPRSLNEVLRPKNDTTSSELQSSESKESSSIRVHYQRSSRNKENTEATQIDSVEIRNKRFLNSKEKDDKSPSVQTNTENCKVLEELTKLTVKPKIKKQQNFEDLPNKVNSCPLRSQSQTRSSAPESARTRETHRSTSTAKSFIRPWKLQVDQNVGNKKSDPVALFHKYQQEWKQLSLPGEERHAKVRWEIREKMLGYDPVSRPILRKSASAVTLRKPHT